MYCYNCGKNIYNGMKKCPCCETEIDHAEITEIIQQNTWAHIAERCPAIEKPHSKTFNIGEHKVTVSGDHYVFAYINVFIKGLQKTIRKEVSEYYAAYSFDYLVKEGENFLRKKFLDFGNAVVGFKYKNSGPITKDDKMAFITTMKYAEQIWKPFYDIAEAFEDLKGELAERRQAMHIDRKEYWVGGGFGVSGAIKGKVQADLLNAGASVKNSVANFASKAIQAGIDHSNVEKLKKEIKNNPELRDAVLSGMDRFFNDWMNFLIDTYLEKRIEFGSHTWLDKKKSTYEEALSILNKEPYNVCAYLSIYYNKPKVGKELSKIVEFLGIEEHVYPLFQLADEELFEEGRLNLHSVGFDTEVTELKRIKEVLIEFEKNNPGYLHDLENENAMREQRYHKKVDALLALHNIDETKKMVDKTFNENSFKDSVLLLIKYNDIVIDNLLFNKLMDRLKKDGGKALIREFDKSMPALAADALMVYWYELDRAKYEKMIQTAVKMGRVFPTAYYGAYCYNKSGDLKAEGVKNLMWAANKNCALAMLYVGRFYKKGINGKYCDREIADSYFRVSAALGSSGAKDELSK